MLTRVMFAVLLLVPSFALAGKRLEQGQSVVYKVGGVEYEGYYTPTPDRDLPLVVMLHDWDGLTDYEKERAQMLRQAGFQVFAADLFGKDVRPSKLEDKRHHTGALYRDPAKMRRLVAAAVDAAKGQAGAAKGVAVIGYCFGGGAALDYLRSGADLDAFVSIHGTLATPKGQHYKNATGRVLVQHGAADSHVSLADFNNLLVQLEASDVDHQMIAYGGAPHAWTVFGQDSFREAADKASWEHLLDFLRDTLK